MMLPTHALAGMALALPLTLVAPELGGVALVGGFVGGVLPDADMYIGHRKALHYPVYYTAFAIPLVAFTVLVPAIPTVFIAFVLLGAALHSVADIFGGGLELRPWEATSERAVYDHHRKRWLPPQRWIHYDGSPGDLALSAGLAVPLLLALEGSLHLIVIATLTVAIAYTMVRRRLPELAVSLVNGILMPHLPAHTLSYLPARYRDIES